MASAQLQSLAPIRVTFLFIREVRAFGPGTKEQNN